MAYADYVNTVNPSYWDAQSGIVSSNGTYSTGGETVTSIAGVRIADFATAWDGTELRIFDQEWLAEAFFVLPVAQPISELYMQGYGHDGSTPGLVLWDAAGDRIPVTWETYPDVVEDIDADIKIWTWSGLLPATIKAFGFTGALGYTNGKPRQIQGIWGTLLAGDPPPPEPFWTNFIRTSEASA